MEPLPPCNKPSNKGEPLNIDVHFSFLFFFGRHNLDAKLANWTVFQSLCRHSKCSQHTTPEEGLNKQEILQTGNSKNCGRRYLNVFLIPGQHACELTPDGVQSLAVWTPWGVKHDKCCSAQTLVQSSLGRSWFNSHPIGGWAAIAYTSDLIWREEALSKGLGTFSWWHHWMCKSWALWLQSILFWSSQEWKKIEADSSWHDQWTINRHYRSIRVHRTLCSKIPLTNIRL